MSEENKGVAENRTAESFRAFPIRAVVVSFILILGLSVAVFARFGDFEQFLRTARQAEPWWLVAAVVLQMLTYVSAGEVWNVAVRAARHPLRSRILSRLAVEKLTIDQFMPSAGVAGHVGTLQAFRRFGVPTPVALEAILVDMLTFSAAYVISALVAFSVLSFHHEVTPIVLIGLGTLISLSIAVFGSTVLLLSHRDLMRKIPGWITQRKLVARLIRVAAAVSSERILAPGIFIRAMFFQIVIFILDGVTLWATLRAVGVHVSFSVAFSAYVIAMVAGTVSLVPGGVGVFEVGAVSTLVGLGVPLEGALAGTLLLRGLTLWVPLIPGAVMAHRDFCLETSRM